ncbi:MAG: hypothetical protein C5B50_00585 [Verrucomicrobia bacterium]|nr:MAG: hypothetical protein C5B50_00585 [Verrucomicrobiota bacterium]
MPIQINLLAESQALEELRRRDPVKRAIWIGLCLVAVMLIWSGYLQLKTAIAQKALSRVEKDIATHAAAFQVVQENQKKLDDVSSKLGKLRQLATNRFLNGTALNALQQTTVDDVQLVRFRVDQKYEFLEATKAKTNADERVTPGRPASATEKIILTLDARDTSANPGDQVNKLKQSVVDSAYFKESFGKTTNQVRLTDLRPPQVGPDGKPLVLFTLECRLPEKTR